jgi:adenosine/AMP kinase
VIDGESPKGIENADETKKRKEFLRAIGYKL